MLHIRRVLSLIYLLSIYASGSSPHVLFVLVDDLGWGDVGFHRTDHGKARDEVQTPNIDNLVREGVHLTRHYVHSSCTGTRAACQSGRFPVHVQTSLKNPEDPSSGMPRNMTGLGEQMRVAGYKTHFVGKWDVGMATPKHTPKGRGYDSSLGYFEHKNDFWTQLCYQSACCHNFNSKQGKNVLNHWEGPIPEEFHGLNITDLWDTDKPAANFNGTDYEEFIFIQRMQNIIDSHDPSDPLFLFYAPHIAHCPLQVPQNYLDRLDFIEDDTDMCKAQTPNILPPSEVPPPPFSCRRQYRAMVALLDDIIGNLTKSLRDRGMWDDLLVVFTSDNGGPVQLEESGATNFPLRGGKYSDFEGGVRATAFVSGGYLPTNLRGVVRSQPIHIADWYATLPFLAGREAIDETAKQSGLPGLDAVNVWPYLHSGDESKLARSEIPLSRDSLIMGDYKLLWTKVVYEAGWTGPSYPNASSSKADVEGVGLNCSNGCLFDVANDPGEHRNLADTEKDVLERMKSRLIEMRTSFFENGDKGIDSCPPGIDMPCACWMAVNYYGGFFGPYQEVNLEHLQNSGALPAIKAVK